MRYIAEIGSAHRGSLSLAVEMVRQAKRAGATAAKFQLGWPLLDSVRGAPMFWYQEISDYCDEIGIEFFASVWNTDGLDIARKVDVMSYKVAYQMKDETKLIAEMVKDGKTIYVSGVGNEPSINVYGIACVSKYPTLPGDHHIPHVFTEHQGGIYGYSSHMHGIADALVAVSKGAKYIEKHVTLNKAENEIRDHNFAISFDEFEQMVKLSNEIRLL